jgi:DNA-binding FadR family transcriptional regulator
MARVFSKQKRPTLMSKALQEIREAIRKGKLKPGRGAALSGKRGIG